MSSRKYNRYCLCECITVTAMYSNGCIRRRRKRMDGKHVKKGKEGNGHFSDFLLNVGSAV